jgi:hypothetical protein
MRRLLRNVVLSLLLYLLVFGALTDRPLSLGLLRLELQQKTARLASLPSPKLVILAGSNGPYSHSCAVIGAMLALPCENAGIAVGIGLDDLFLRYEPLLRRGDIVYMPMELEQYTASAAQYRAGVDGALLLRFDRSELAALPPGRIAGALLCCTLGDFVESLVEMPLAWRGVIAPAHVLASEYNADGDRIDTPLDQALPALLDLPARPVPTASEISSGYGRALIADFVQRETAKGVVVAGGLPVDFSSARPPPDVLAALSSAYAGQFIVLANSSLYPRADFFNSEDHLAQPCQYLQSIKVAAALAALLHRPLYPAPPWVLAAAASCPSAQSN